MIKTRYSEKRSEVFMKLFNNISGNENKSRVLPMYETVYGI